MRFTIPLLALTAIAAPANASTVMQPIEEIVDVRIAYDDIDITTADGRAQLEDRINAALRKACTIESAVPYRSNVVDQRCLADARADAKAQLDRMAASEPVVGRELSAL